MSTLENFKSELAQESVVTRKMLAIIPADQYDWQPHVKSMTIRQLAGHIAELPSWIAMAFTTDELDFAKIDYAPPVWNSTEELLGILEQSINQANEQLDKATENDLSPEWILRHGEQVLSRLSKGGLVRLALSQTIHHRAQLGVYLRLLNIPIPGSYGPSADDASF